MLAGVVLPPGLMEGCDKTSLRSDLQCAAVASASSCPGPGISPGFAAIKVQRTHRRSGFEALILQEYRGSLFIYFAPVSERLWT